MLFADRAGAARTFWRSIFASMATSTSCGRDSECFGNPRARRRAPCDHFLPPPTAHPSCFGAGPRSAAFHAVHGLNGSRCTRGKLLVRRLGGRPRRNHGRSIRPAGPRHVLTDPLSLPGAPALSSICNAGNGLRMDSRRGAGARTALRGSTRTAAVLAEAPPTPATYESHGAGTRVMIIGETPDLWRVGVCAGCVMSSLA